MTMPTWPALSEPELISAHGGLPRRHEPCACGSVITASLARVDWPDALRAHNETPRHQLWRRRREDER